MKNLIFCAVYNPETCKLRKDKKNNLKYIHQIQFHCDNNKQSKPPNQKKILLTSLTPPYEISMYLVKTI